MHLTITFNVQKVLIAGLFQKHFRFLVLIVYRFLKGKVMTTAFYIQQSTIN